MFLGRKVKWLDRETFEQEQCWNWHYRACHHVDVFPGLDPRLVDIYNVGFAVHALLRAQEYLQQTTAIDWDHDCYHRVKLCGPPHGWYRAGLGSRMLNHLGRQRAWSCLLRLPTVRAESLTRARNLEARATLARFFRGRVDVIDVVMQYVEKVG